MENNHIEPPPFKKSQEPKTVNQEPSSETNGLDALGLEAEKKKQIEEMLQNAEMQGYLRGRNEKIEATQHFENDPELDLQPTGFPVYNRRSIWDS